MQRMKSLRCTMQVLLWSADVLGWLQGVVQSAGDTVNLHRLAVDCFGAWVRLGCLYERDLPREAVEGLVALAFSSIHSPDPGTGWERKAFELRKSEEDFSVSNSW